jgi:NAD(P)-dependent dehydrogenase (short-subunit alcohol dehydrogenase family)
VLVARGAGRRVVPGELEQVVALGERQVQAAGDRGEHRLGRRGTAALLEAPVVVGRHPAQRGDLLAAQPHGPASLPSRQAHVLRLHRLAARAQEVGELGAVHRAIVPRPRDRNQGSPIPGWVRPGCRSPPAAAWEDTHDGRSLMSQRIALVTGGSRGLGRATALALADSGVDVILTYRSGAEQAAEVVAAIGAVGRRAVALPLETTDLASHAAFAEQVRTALADTWGRDSFDLLMNNAGSSGETPIGATDADEVQRLFDVHFRSVVMLTQELLPLLADEGRILNVSTGLTLNLVNPAYSVYAAMKAAIEVYSRYLAKSLGARGIAVNVLAPGATATDFGGGSIRDNEQYRAGIVASSAMGRVGEPDDIGRAAAAILSEGMGWVTGQRIEAAGGQGMGFVGR